MLATVNHFLLIYIHCVRSLPDPKAKPLDKTIKSPPHFIGKIKFLPNIFLEISLSESWSKQIKQKQVANNSRTIQFPQFAGRWIGRTLGKIRLRFTGERSADQRPHVAASCLADQIRTCCPHQVQLRKFLKVMHCFSFNTIDWNPQRNHLVPL